jgi:hypothetical protein
MKSNQECYTCCGIYHEIVMSLAKTPTLNVATLPISFSAMYQVYQSGSKDVCVLLFVRCSEAWVFVICATIEALTDQS